MLPRGRFRVARRSQSKAEHPDLASSSPQKAPSRNSTRISMLSMLDLTECKRARKVIMLSGTTSTVVAHLKSSTGQKILSQKAKSGRSTVVHVNDAALWLSHQSIVHSFRYRCHNFCFPAELPGAHARSDSLNKSSYQVFHHIPPPVHIHFVFLPRTASSRFFFF